MAGPSTHADSPPPRLFFTCCRTYTNWDAYLCTNQFVSNLLISRTLLKALADVSVLKYTWHMHLNILLNLITCGAHLAFILRWPFLLLSSS